MHVYTNADMKNYGKFFYLRFMWTFCFSYRALRAGSFYWHIVYHGGFKIDTEMKKITIKNINFDLHLKIWRLFAKYLATDWILRQRHFVVLFVNVRRNVLCGFGIMYEVCVKDFSCAIGSTLWQMKPFYTLLIHLILFDHGNQSERYRISHAIIDVVVLDDFYWSTNFFYTKYHNWWPISNWCFATEDPIGSLMFD